MNHTYFASHRKPFVFERLLLHSSGFILVNKITQSKCWELAYRFRYLATRHAIFLLAHELYTKLTISFVPVNYTTFTTILRGREAELLELLVEAHFSSIRHVAPLRCDFTDTWNGVYRSQKVDVSIALFYVYSLINFHRQLCLAPSSCTPV